MRAFANLTKQETQFLEVFEKYKPMILENILNEVARKTAMHIRTVKRLHKTLEEKGEL